MKNKVLNKITIGNVIIILAIICFSFVMMNQKKVQETEVEQQEMLSNVDEDKSNNKEVILIDGVELNSVEYLIEHNWISSESNISYSYIRQNTQRLQRTIDEVADAGGGTIRIPAGTYYFTPIEMGYKQDGTTEFKEYVLRPRSNVKIVGAGKESTIFKLKNTATTGNVDFFFHDIYNQNGYTGSVNFDEKTTVHYDRLGVDLTYEDYVYLRDADFEGFSIDASNSVGGTFNGSGTGFYFNLFVNCDWKDVIVKRTDSSGFLLINPINSTITTSGAYGNGKRAGVNDTYGSGFDIRTGLTSNEMMYIDNSFSINNSNFGFAFSDQGKTNSSKYNKAPENGFVVNNSKAGGNTYNYGGLKAVNVTYQNVQTIQAYAGYNANTSATKKEVYFTEYSVNSYVYNSKLSNLSSTSEYGWLVDRNIMPAASFTSFGGGNITPFDIVYALYNYRKPGGTRSANTTATENTRVLNEINRKYGAPTNISSHSDAYDMIYWALENNIIKNTTDLNATLSIGEYLNYLYKYIGSPSVSYSPYFHSQTNRGMRMGEIEDFNESKSYYNAVVWALNNRIWDHAIRYREDEICDRYTRDFLHFHPEYPDDYTHAIYGDKYCIQWHYEYHYWLDVDAAITKTEAAHYLYYAITNYLSNNTVTYNLMGGTLNGRTGTYKGTYGRNSTYLGTPTRPGYYFEGWTGSGYSTPRTGAATPYAGRENLVYTAVWKKTRMIGITASNSKYSYKTDESFDRTKVNVYAVYSDGSQVLVNNNEWEYSLSSNFLSTGRKIVTITYAGYQTQFEVTVVDKDNPDPVLDRITVINTKYEYSLGSDLDKSTIIVTGIYNIGSPSNILVSTCSFSKENLDVVGVQTIFVTCQGVTSEFNVSVIDGVIPDLESIELDVTKTKYYLKDKIDKGSVNITGTFSDGTTSEISPISCTFSPSDFYTLGEKLVEVKCDKAKATFTVEVEEKPGEKTLTAIDVTTTKSEYQQNQTIDTSTITIIGTYSDGTTGNINPKSCYYSPSIFISLGDQAVTVTCEGNQESRQEKIINIKVVPQSGGGGGGGENKTLTSINATTSKNTYNKGESLDVSTVNIIGTYSDGSKGAVSPSSCNYNPSQFDTVGTQQIEVKCGEVPPSTFSVTVNNAVVSKTLTSISVASSKSKYKVGESLDLNKITVIGTYSDNSTSNISAQSCTFTPNKFETAGTITVKSTCYEKEKNFIVTVENVTVPKTLSKIDVSTTKDSYNKGDHIDVSTVTITGTYSDNSTAEIPVSSCTFSPITLGTAGTQSVNVSCLGKSKSFQVTVEDKIVDKVLSSLSISNTKPIYTVGDNLDTTKITVTGTYSDGSSATIPNSSCTFSPTELNEIGTKTITVKCLEKTTVTNVTVNPLPTTNKKLSSITATTTKQTYNKGETLDVSYVKIIGTYEDGSTDVLETNKCTFSPTSLNTAGEQNITVTCSGKSTTFTITVNNTTSSKTLSSITASTPKVDYNKGETLDTSSFTITGTYSDGSKLTIANSSCAFSPTELNTPGSQTITITCNEKSTTNIVTIIDTDKILTSIKATPSQNTYTQGQAINPAKVSIEGTLKDGTKTTIASSTCDYSPSILSSTGEQTITVICKGLTTTFKVTVNAPAATLSSIAATATKTEYTQGQTPDKNSITVIGTYSDGTSKNLDITSCVVSPGTLNNTGTETVQVTCNGKKSSFNVTVNPKPVTKTLKSISATTSKNSYNKGETLDITKFSITGTYSDNSTDTIASDTCSYSPVKLNTTGNQTVTVTCNDKRTTVVVSVSATETTKTLSSITAETTKTTYTKGETLNTTTVKVTAKYSDGSTATIPSASCYFSPMSLVTVGTQQITVTYGGKSTNFEITVYERPENKTVKEITATPKKKYYTQGEAIDPSQIDIIGDYSDGTTGTISPNTCTYTPSVFETAGTQEVTVNCEGKTSKVVVNVAPVSNPKTLKSISATTTKNTYQKNESLDLSTITVTAIYSDGSTGVVPNTDCTFSVNKFTGTGNQKVNVTFGGKSASFTVNVTAAVTLKSISIKERPSKTSYTVGDTLDTTNLKINLNYSDGTTKVITSGFTVSPTELNTSGTRTISVRYEGLSTSFEVSVAKPTLESISMYSLPSRTSYFVGDKFISSGLKIALNYSNGYVEYKNSGYTLSVESGTTLNEEGTKEVVVTYNEMTTKFNIEVKKSEKKTTVVSNKPGKTSYEAGDTFDPSGLEIEYIDEDGNKKTITTGFTTSPAAGTPLDDEGEQKVTVTYEGTTTEIIINVKKPVKATVKDGSVKTAYKPGEKFSSTGIVLIVEYSDGTKREVSQGISLSMDDGTELSKTSEKDVVVTYGKISTILNLVIDTPLASPGPGGGSGGGSGSGDEENPESGAFVNLFILATLAAIGIVMYKKSGKKFYKI